MSPDYPEFRPDCIPRLTERLHPVMLRRRLGMQRTLMERIRFAWRRGGPRKLGRRQRWLRAGLRGLGLYGRGLANARRIELHENTIELQRLPPSLDGLRVLHLSDLHLDFDLAITEALHRALDGLEYDLCVITGDLPAHTYGPFDAAIKEIERLAARLQAQCRGPIYAVPGNHDYIELVPICEDLGIRFLINESATYETVGGRLHIAGVDDPHFFGTHNLDQAAEQIPEEACALLLGHSPDLFRHAALAGFDALLCGHTHGGQICLPGGYAPVTHSRCPRHMVSGAWQFRQMQGYTSRGSGCSILPVRYNCPPEVVIHRLVRQLVLHCGSL